MPELKAANAVKGLIVEPGGRFSSKAMLELTTARTRPVCGSMIMMAPRRSPRAVVAIFCRRRSRSSSLSAFAEEADQLESCVAIRAIFQPATSTQIVRALIKNHRGEFIPSVCAGTELLNNGFDI